MKRQTVLRMLKNRLSDAKWCIQVAKQYDDLTNVLGGRDSPDQFYVNMQNDIKELEYLINCLTEYKLKNQQHGSE